jgi:hypothetical protein
LKVVNWRGRQSYGAGLVKGEAVLQEIHGDRNKQAAIIGSPGASIKM